MKTPCKNYESELSAYLDGELEPVRHADVAHHLGVCVACARELAHLQGVSSLLRRWDAAETRYAASHAFRNRVVERVGPGAPSGRSAPVFSPWFGRVAAAAAVIAAASLGAVYGVGNDTSEDDGRLDDLRRQVAQLRADLDRPATVPSAERADLPTRVLPDWAPVVDPLTARMPLAGDASDPGARSYEYEQRGEFTVVSEALLPLQDFERDQKLLSVEEKVLARAAAPAGANPSEGGRAPSPIANFLANAEVAAGEFDAYKKVQVWPITISAAAAAEGDAPLLAKEALKAKILEVRESDLEGMEGMVVFDNRDASRPVLVLAGDVFAGGKQDRVAQEDMLIAPGASMHVRVMTSGRRRARTSYRRFRDSPGLAPTGLRALIAADVSQREFDKSVLHTFRGLATPPRQGSLDGLYGSNTLSTEISSRMKHFTARLDAPEVIGFAVSAGSELLGVELFGDRATFEAAHDRVLRSYVLAALAKDRLDGPVPMRHEIAGLLTAAAQGVVGAQSTSGAGRLGAIVDLESGAFGYGLLADTGVVHASIFPRRPEGVPPVGRGKTSRGTRDVPAGATPIGGEGGRSTDDRRAGESDGPAVGPR